MHISWVTLALQAVNFLVLVWLLQRFLYRPVLGAIARRQAEVDRVTSEAALALQSADSRRRELEEQRAAIDQERKRVLAEAAARAEALAAEARTRARADGDALTAESRALLGREREEAECALEKRASGLAIDLAASLLAAFGPPDVGPFLDRALARLRVLPVRRRRALAPPGGEALRVVTAAKLTEDEQRRCRSELSALLGEEPTIAFEQDQTLAGGVELHFPHEVLRCSWRAELAAAREELLSHADAARRAG